ncbi:polysaccharide biosynthesis protein [Salegentibacter sp. BLCTC]|uniref:PssD/Cps14F family polysaccharide biosynthesis glycosyltransferase n=1 Tax=Salegentibacter sp. BLCTC TaxID=2697368 RepID=UPI00187B64A2|nr:PssD/Cps14F family polysaccharide biosynthesis glycosyltransferase [Salegentibacter sp. BLCTC]MBE7639953.1 polysaccharide biosynthesis protein [Salegentibacter sp. BLCTC]
MRDKRKKIILICSDGGHLAQILELRDMFLNYNYLIVTEKSPATIPLKEKYNIKYLKGRSKGQKRNLSFIFSLIVNTFLSLKILMQHYPKVIITTGSHTAIPMCFLGKLVGAKIIWILSYARINSRAFSADIVYPIANKFIVQWPGVQKFYKKAIYLGGIY